MKPRTVLFGLGLIGLALATVRAQAQSAKSRRIAIALVESLSAPRLRAEILRFSDPKRPDVILLRGDAAAPSDLAAAISSYRRATSDAPVKPGQMTRLELADLDARALVASAGRRVRAAEMLARVRREPLRRVGNYGRGRWMTFEIRVRR